MTFVILWLATLCFIFLDIIFSVSPKFIFYYRISTAAIGALFFMYYSYFNIIRKPSLSDAARYIEKSDSIGNCLSSSIEIGEAEVIRYGFSRELYSLTLSRAVDYYSKKDFSTYINASILRKIYKVIVILLISSLITAGFPGGIKRLGKIWPGAAALFMPDPGEISSINRDFTAFTDEGMDIVFKFGRKEPLDIIIEQTTDSRKDPFHQINPEYENYDFKYRVQSLKPNRETGETELLSFSFSSFAPSYNFYYRARSRASDSTSGTYFVKTKKRPALIKINAAYEFPKYTKIAPMLEENATAINGLYMTKVTISAYSNVKLGEAKLIFSTNVSLSMDIAADKKSASAPFNITSKNSYKIVLKDEEGNSNKDAKFYDINVYDDKYPSCEIIEPAGIINATPEKKIDISVKAKDDFGISKITLFWYKDEADQSSREISLHESQAAEIFEKTSLSFDDMTFAKGEALYYYAAAYDNDDISGPKMTKSAVNKINFPTQFDEALELEQMYGSIEARLTKITAEQKSVAEKVEKLDQLRKQGSMNEYELKKNFENISRAQQGLIEETKELAGELKETLKKMENNVYIKPETLSKINEIQEKIQQVLNEDMKRVMDELSKNVQQTKLSGEDVKKLSQSFDEKKLVEKFERLKELFSKAEKEQKLSTFMKELEFCLEKQEFVMENTEKTSPELKELNLELSNEQKNIKESFDKAAQNFDKNIDELSQISEELKQAAAEASQNLKSDAVSDKMQKAHDALSKSTPKEAFENQKPVVESLAKNLSSLKKAFENFKEKNKKELMDELMKLIERTIAMSKFEREITQGFSTVAALNRPSTAEKYVETIDSISEKSIETSNVSRAIAGDLVKLSKKTVLIDPQHIALAGSIMQMFSKIKPMLAERNVTGAANLNLQIYTSVNMLNLTLLNIFDIISSAKSGSNMDQLMSMLKKQTEAQARLNEKTKKMSQNLGEDGMPQLSSDAMKSMAFEQQMIRRSLERMMEGMDSQSDAAKKLRELRSEMQNLEIEYMRKRVDTKIQSRQKLLHERLLDMQQALFKEKQTNERKAERANQFTPKSPEELAKKNGVQKQELKMEDSLKNEKYPKSYEKIIELYFSAIKKL